MFYFWFALILGMQLFGDLCCSWPCLPPKLYFYFPFFPASWGKASIVRRKKDARAFLFTSGSLSGNGSIFSVVPAAQDCYTSSFHWVTPKLHWHYLLCLSLQPKSDCGISFLLICGISFEFQVLHHLCDQFPAIHFSGRKYMKWFLPSWLGPTQMGHSLPEFSPSACPELQHWSPNLKRHSPASGVPLCFGKCKQNRGKLDWQGHLHFSGLLSFSRISFQQFLTILLAVWYFYRDCAFYFDQLFKLSLMASLVWITYSAFTVCRGRTERWRKRKTDPEDTEHLFSVLPEISPTPTFIACNPGSLFCWSQVLLRCLPLATKKFLIYTLAVLFRIFVLVFIDEISL